MEALYFIFGAACLLLTLFALGSIKADFQISTKCPNCGKSMRSAKVERE